MPRILAFCVLKGKIEKTKSGQGRKREIDRDRDRERGLRTNVECVRETERGGGG